MKRKTLPENHESIADTLNNLGSVCSATGDKNKAKGFYVEALEIKKKTLPENHPSIVDALKSLGTVYKDLGDIHKALEFYEKALEISSTTSRK